jgi:oligopeptide transport system permease protein
VLRLDLGPSFRYPDHDVNYFILTSLPKSMLLGVISLSIAVLLGIGTGIVSAARQNTWMDYTFMSAAVVGITVPLFVIGPVLMYIFAMKLGWLPTSGWITSKYGFVTLIMPVATLAFPYFAYVARLSRASILEVLRSDYVRTARAKGLREPVIMFKHVLKGALLPVVSYLGPAFAGIVTGSVVVERIFRIPGLGQFFVQSAFNRDYTLLMGTVIVYSLILVIMNFIVDIAYGWLDPRISYS